MVSTTTSPMVPPKALLRYWITGAATVSEEVP
jgi:hypothetical protein